MKIHLIKIHEHKFKMKVFVDRRKHQNYCNLLDIIMTHIRREGLINIYCSFHKVITRYLNKIIYLCQF